eukprot:COSAG02_NODE_44925_length_361_cov_2.851145_1_plen_24_part_10
MFIIRDGRTDGCKGCGEGEGLGLG